MPPQSIHSSSPNTTLYIRSPKNFLPVPCVHITVMPTRVQHTEFMIMQNKEENERKKENRFECLAKMKEKTNIGNRLDSHNIWLSLRSRVELVGSINVKIVYRTTATTTPSLDFRTARNAFVCLLAPLHHIARLSLFNAAQPQCAHTHTGERRMDEKERENK